jgi:hypothetical protein
VRLDANLHNAQIMSALRWSFRTYSPVWQTGSLEGAADNGKVEQSRALCMVIHKCGVCPRFCFQSGQYFGDVCAIAYCSFVR